MRSWLHTRGHAVACGIFWTLTSPSISPQCQKEELDLYNKSVYTVFVRGRQDALHASVGLAPVRLIGVVAATVDGPEVSVLLLTLGPRRTERLSLRGQLSQAHSIFRLHTVPKLKKKKKKNSTRGQAAPNFRKLPHLVIPPENYKGKVAISRSQRRCRLKHISPTHIKTMEDPQLSIGKFKLIFPLGFLELSAPCLEYAANYRQIIVCWHRKIGRRLTVCARQPCICAGLSTGHKYRNVRAQMESASGLKPEKIPTWFHTAQMKKRHAQGFPAFDTKRTAAYSKHGVNNINMPSLIPGQLVCINESPRSSNLDSLWVCFTEVAPCLSHSVIYFSLVLYLMSVPFTVWRKLSSLQSRPWPSVPAGESPATSSGSSGAAAESCWRKLPEDLRRSSSCAIPFMYWLPASPAVRSPVWENVRRVVMVLSFVSKSCSTALPRSPTLRYQQEWMINAYLAKKKNKQKTHFSVLSWAGQQCSVMRMSCENGRLMGCPWWRLLGLHGRKEFDSEFIYLLAKIQQHCLPDNISPWTHRAEDTSPWQNLRAPASVAEDTPRSVRIVLQKKKLLASRHMSKKSR